MSDDTQGTARSRSLAADMGLAAGFIAVFFRREEHAKSGCQPSHRYVCVLLL